MSNGPNKDSIINDINQLNANTLLKEMEWFASVMQARLKPYLPKQQANSPPEDQSTKEAPTQGKSLWRIFDKKHQEDPATSENILALPKGKSEIIQTPDLVNNNSFYARFVKQHHLITDDRLIMMLTLAPHIQPQLLDQLLLLNQKTGLGHSLFGGVTGSKHGGFLPTIETALFILAGENLDYRLKASLLFSPNHTLIQQNIIQTATPPVGEPYQASSINLSEEALSQILYGKSWQPRFSTDFPAKRLTTTLVWEDLVLDTNTQEKINMIDRWLDNNSSLRKDYPGLYQLKPGFKALFSGPPGTGKTLTAALLGKKHQLDIFRIDLSMVVSKYIGETEKNLEKIFAMAESQHNWILFFDEADALFGKRTSISDAHDKYANQEIAYLLQRLEDYPGLVILASNMRHNIDEAFSRRMQAMVHFPKPTVEERKRLWNKALKIADLEEFASPFVEALSNKFNLTGAGIMNVVHHATINRLAETIPKDAKGKLGEDQFEAFQNLILQFIYQGIRYEYEKEGKHV